jgi:CSLREA domain-containing protein
VGGAAALVAAVLLVTGSGGAPALGAAPACSLAPQLRDITINQGLGSYAPLAWGKDTLLRLYMSQPSCAASGSLIQVTGATLTIAGGGANRTISATTPSLVSVYPALATYSTAPAVDSTGDVKFDVPGSTLSPGGSEGGFAATFTATINYVQQPNSRTPLAPGSVSFSVRPGTNTAITAPVAKKTNALRVLVVPMGDPQKLYNTQLTAAGQQEIQRGMLTLARIFPLRDGIATLTDTSTAGLAAGLRYSISPTLLNVGALMTGGIFCGNSSNFTTLRGLLAQFLQAWNSANSATPADRVLGVGDQAVANGGSAGCDEGRAAINGNEAWVRLAYDVQGTPSSAGALMGMELAHTMGAVPAGRNDGAFHSLYTNADYLVGDLNRAFNVATRSVLAGTSDDHTVMRLASPWNNTNTVLEKADWGLLLCRLGGPATSDCATAGTVGSAAAGPTFVTSGTTSGAAGICATCVGAAAGTNVVESYFATSAKTLPDPASQYRLVQKKNGAALAAPYGSQGVPIAAADTHHNGTPSQTDSEAGLFSVALPFDTNADRIELWKGAPGATGSLLLYARNTSAAPTVTSMTSGGPILLSLNRSAKAGTASPPAVRVSKPSRGTTRGRRTLHGTRRLQSPAPLRNPLSVAAALTTSFTVNDTGDGGDSNLADDLCKDTGGNCTLRAAIQQANATAGADTVTFSIGTGPVTIQVGTTALPQITGALVIDGTTQGGSGYTGPPLVELDGSASPGYGLASSAVVTIRGLVMNRFASGSAIALFSGSGDSVVQGNYLGTNLAGGSAAGNAGAGVQVFSSGNTIGGANASDRNVISANDTGIALLADNNTVTGNYIGTDAAGTSGLGNASAGIVLQGSSSNTITNNVISGTKPTNASGAGIDLVQSATQSTNNVIQGNFIGTDKTGSNALGNSRRGISLNGASNNTIGGSGPGQANVISGNTGDGIDLPNGQQNAIRGNLIGVAANGTSPLGNGGFGIQMNSSINAIGGSAAGDGNVIANNNGAGIVISGGTGNGVLGNRFYANASLGINLGIDPVTANDAGDTDVGANNLQNFPVISSATLSGGTLHLVGTLDTNAGLANPGFRIEAFLNSACDPSGNGEGEFFVGAGSVSVDGSGHAAFTIDLPTSATGTVATATATAAGTGDTSEFSACASVTGGGGGGGGGGPFVVNTTNDANDGTCDATHCSLREAILAANAHSNGDGPDDITFAIAGAGPHQIAVLSSALPTVTDPVTIDGDTERLTGTGIPADSKAIVLNGDGAGATADGVVLAAGSGGSEVKGLAIRDFKCSTAPPASCASGYGLRLQSDGNTVDGNYIGLTADGVTPARNEAGGILVEGNGNTIGGTASPERNVVAGNAVPSSVRSQILVTGNTNAIKGNYIGVAANGTTEQNNVTGVTVQGGAHDNVIGVDKTVGNIILGRQGIEITANAGTGNVIAGNNIGLDAAGAVHASVLPGIHVSGTGTIIGDNVSPPVNANRDRGNVIVGSGDAGIFMQSANSAKITGNFVGTNRSGASGMGNADGIRVSAGGNNTVGPGNTFAFNTAYGVDMGSATNRVVANSIHDNAQEGIHNTSPFVAPPTLTSAVKSGTNTTVNGTFSGTANTLFFIEFFKNTACDGSGAGEGETYLGFASPTTNGAGSASYSFSSATLNAGDIITATATSSTAFSTSEFSICKQVVTSTTPPGQEEFDVGGSDDNAHDDVLDLYLDCGVGGKFPIALALSPGSATNTTANWTYNYDASLACEGGQMRAIVNDGFQQSAFTSTGTEPTQSGQKSPFSAILSPGKGKTFLQYSAIPLKGIAVDPEDGALTPHWKLINSGNSVIKTADGTTADLSPGANGWTPGSYTVELTATDSASKTTTSTVNITIVADADNDGIPAASENGCLGSSDTNPMDAYGDKDLDGIPNADDPEPCTAQTGPYTAVMSFQPNPFPISSSGNTVNVTVRVPYRSLNQVLATSVAIARINGDPVTFKSVSWKVTDNVGQALFDRQALVTYLMNHHLQNSNVVFTIGGRSAAPPWSFEGVATTFVTG